MSQGKKMTRWDWQGVCLWLSRALESQAEKLGFHPADEEPADCSLIPPTPFFYTACELQMMFTFLFYLSYLIFWLHHRARGILVPQPGNLCPLQWKHGKSYISKWLEKKTQKNSILCWSHAHARHLCVAHGCFQVAGADTDLLRLGGVGLCTSAVTGLKFL